MHYTLGKQGIMGNSVTKGSNVAPGGGLTLGTVFGTVGS